MTLQSADNVAIKWNHRAEEKDRSISNGEAPLKQHKSGRGAALRFIIFLPSARKARSTPDFIYNIIKY